MAVTTPSLPPRSRVGMISLGCPKNLVDSEIMLGELARQGYEVTADLESAGTVVINTCAFIEEAKQESIDAILEVVGRKGQGVERVLVAGCMVESLVAEARQLEEAGILELNLIAQDTTRYGEDLGLGRHGMVRLVEALLAATSIRWIRFLYAYPTTLDEDLLRLMGSEPRVCSYLDMPLQHSPGDMLKAMPRGGDAGRYLRLLDRPRHLAPAAFLRPTFILAFPAEPPAHSPH